MADPDDDKGITAALRQALPPAEQPQADQLAALLERLASRQFSDEALAAYLRTHPGITRSITALAGRQIRARQALIEFGSGSQAGDITIRDVAAGDISHINIYYIGQGVAAQQNQPINQSRRALPGYSWVWLSLATSLLLISFTLYAGRQSDIAAGPSTDTSSLFPPTDISVTSGPPPTSPSAQSAAAPPPPATDLEFSPAREGEILIIIAQFDGDGSLNPEDRIERSLEQQLEQIQSLSGVRVERHPEPVLERSKELHLEALRRLYSPGVIIWGWYDLVGINTRFEFTHQAEGFARTNSFLLGEYKPTLAEGLRLSSDPDSFAFYLSRDLPQEVTYLTLFAIGKIYMMGRNYEQAEVYLARAQNSLPEHLKSSYTEEQFLLLLGNIRLIGHDDHAFAIQQAEMILEKNPASFGAHNLRSMAYELMQFSQYIQDRDISISIDVQVVNGQETVILSSDQFIPVTALRSAEALDSINFMIQNGINEPEAYYRRGLQHYAFGNLQQAIDDMNIYIAGRSEGPVVEQARGFVETWSLELSEP